MAVEMKFKIVQHYGVISESKGWTLELNRVSWNDALAKLDIRRWNADHSKSSKAGTLTDEEAEKLHKLLGTALEI